MTSLKQDLLYGYRLLLKHPGFTAVAVLSIALGIAANTTVFSVLNTLRFRPLPFEQPHQLVRITEIHPERGGARGPTFRTYSAWKQESRSFENIGLAGADSRLSIHGEGGAERIRCQGFDVDLLDILGVQPILGRRLVEEDMGGTFSTTALISYDLWQRRFGGDQDVVGRKLALEDGVLTIAGIMPPGFWLFPWANDVDLWSGFDLSSIPDSRFLTKIGRLKAGVTLEQAQAELATISQRVEETQVHPDPGWIPHLEPLRQAYLGTFQMGLYFLLGAVAFVLLIACTNVANLMLARGNTRRKEFAIRASVGGGRARLIRQLLTESILISSLGGAIGLMLTVWGIGVYVSLAPQWFPLTEEVRIDGLVLAFTAGTAIISGLLFGLAPSLQVSKLTLLAALKDSGQKSNAHGRQSGRALLLASEVALAIVLLSGAALMIRGYLNESSSNLGFEPEGLLTTDFRLAGKAYFSDLPGGAVRVTQQTENFYRQFLARIRSVPGVESAGITNTLPIYGFSERAFAIAGRTPLKPEERPRAAFNEVDPGLFRALKIPLRQGRYLDSGDDHSSPWVAVINQTFARRFFPGEDPLGQALRLTMGTEVRGKSEEEDQTRVIVGVIGDVKYVAMDEDPPAAIYTSYLQRPSEFPHGSYGPHVNKSLAVRASGDPLRLAPVVRAAAAEIDPTQAPFDVVTMEYRLAESLAAPRLLIQLFSAFAFFAVLLAAVGIYGVFSYSVNERRPELALRAALGARRRELTRLVVNQMLRLALLGAIVGSALTFALSALVANRLFGVESVDLVTFSLVILTMIAVALLAAYLPARRAARVDPMEALRYE